jgi:hypothetical protein
MQISLPSSPVRGHSCDSLGCFRAAGDTALLSRQSLDSRLKGQNKYPSRQAKQQADFKEFARLFASTKSPAFVHHSQKLTPEIDPSPL